MRKFSSTSRLPPEATSALSAASQEYYQTKTSIARKEIILLASTVPFLETLEIATMNAGKEATSGLLML